MTAINLRIQRGVFTLGILGLMTLLNANFAASAGMIFSETKSKVHAGTKAPLLAQNGNQDSGPFGVPERYRQQPVPQAEQQPSDAPPVEPIPPDLPSEPEPEKPDGADSISPSVDTGGIRHIPESGEIELNFDNAELDEVVRTLAEILNINYVLDPGVKGQVTIQTAGSLQKEELFSVFLQILQVNGLTAVKEGNLYKIVPMKDAPRQPIEYNKAERGRSDSMEGPEAQPVVQIIPLDYIDPEEMAKILEPFVSAQGTIVSHGEAQTLIVVDTLSNIHKILNLVSAFDINFFEKIKYRFYPLEYADAANVAQTLQSIMGSMGKNLQQEVSFVAIERMNTLLAVGANPQVFDKITHLVRELDAVPADTEPKLYIYFVKNGQAGELAELLNQVFSGEAGQRKKKDSVSARERNPYSIPESPRENKASEVADQPKSVESGSVGPETSAALGANVQITADEIRNALVIEATPKDYQVVERILTSLDVLPRQVLIEVTIAEITLTTSLELGVEWQYVKGDGGLSTSLLAANAGSAGLQYIIGQANRWSAALSALAREDKVNILSSPTVLASDNKEARIDISREVPVASAQFQYTGETEPLLQTNIQYRNTGVILTVTPHINEFGLVSMDISQEVSELSDSVQVGNESLPSFFKRTVDTSLTVRHGQTIVIGGLIRENRSRGRSGVPCLGGVPGLDWIFGRKTNSKDKTELIILITPRVIATLEDVDAITQEFKRKVGHVIDQGVDRK